MYFLVDLSGIGRDISLVIVTYRTIFAVLDGFDHKWSKDFLFYKM